MVDPTSLEIMLPTLVLLEKVEASPVKVMGPGLGKLYAEVRALVTFVTHTVPHS